MFWSAQITYISSLIADEVGIVHRALCIVIIVDSSSLSQPKDQKSSMSRGRIWKGRGNSLVSMNVVLWSMKFRLTLFKAELSSKVPPVTVHSPKLKIAPPSRLTEPAVLSMKEVRLTFRVP